MQLSTVSHTFHNLSQPLWHRGYKQPLTSILKHTRNGRFYKKMLKPEYLRNQKTQKRLTIISEKITSRPFQRYQYLFFPFSIS